VGSLLEKQEQARRVLSQQKLDNTGARSEACPQKYLL
jgi:hypothetical protein